jgi:coenzyme F420-0:L-glutamate ligase/coenzyme F420-1:gamma-L-glutamate ligase
LIVRHRLGFVCANAGIDHSNTRPGGQWRLLLSVDPDRTANVIRQRLEQHYQAIIGLIISDSHGRPFRMGTVGVAIGSAGLPALWNLRGKPDLFGTALQVTEVGFADELAAAAGLVLGQSNESIPAAIIRGLAFPADDSARALDLVRPRDLDLYR